MSTNTLTASTPTTFEPLLNTEQAAKLLNMHPHRLMAAARSGLIPAFRYGRAWQFRASALNAWLEAQTAKSKQSATKVAE